MKSVEGSLLLRVAWDGRKIQSVDPRLDRPAGLVRFLSGRSFSEAIGWFYSLYTLCQTAQTLAATVSAEALTGRSVPPEVLRWRNRLLRWERFSESMMRILEMSGELALEEKIRDSIRGPLRRLLGGVETLKRNPAWREPWKNGAKIPDEETSLQSEIEATARVLLEGFVLGMDASSWMKGLVQGQDGGLLGEGPVSRAIFSDPDPGPPSEPRFVTLRDPDETWRRISEDLGGTPGFASRPSREGAPAETGALARHHTHPGLFRRIALEGATPRLRLIARLVDLVSVVNGRSPEDEEPGTPQDIRVISGGTGEKPVVQILVETARGTLLHRVEGDEGGIRKYQVLAPTEWNLHPEGPLSVLRGVPAPTRESVLDRVRTMVISLDPCVSFDIGVDRA